MKAHKLKSSFGIAPAMTNFEGTNGRSAVASPLKRKPKQPAPVAAATEVEARIDVGLGNTLFIRGQGDGLSWDKGTPLTCKEASRWVWSTLSASERVVFKLLLNDIIWSQGEDMVVQPGKRIEVVPRF